MARSAMRWAGRMREGGRAGRDMRRARDYQPWQGWQSGPKGTITDDTQMTMWMAESILAAGLRTLDRLSGILTRGACRVPGEEKGLTTPHPRGTIAARTRRADGDGWEETG
jgi:ADP-ribosylglycohydrolase